MQQLTELTNKLAASLVSADADDPRTLTDILNCFQGLSDQLKQISDGETGSAIRQVSGKSQELMEQIILREVGDTISAMKTINQNVLDIQQMVDAALSGRTVSSTVVQAATEKAEAAIHAPKYDIGGDYALSADDLPLISEFIAEANGHIASAEAELLKVEENPADVDSINAIFRAFHTIKGVAGFLNLKQIGALSHAAENLLDLGRKGKLRLEGSCVDVILEAIDMTKDMVLRIDTAAKSNEPVRSEPKLLGLLDRLHAAASGGSVLAAVPASAAAPVAALAPATTTNSTNTSAPLATSSPIAQPSPASSGAAAVSVTKQEPPAASSQPASAQATVAPTQSQAGTTGNSSSDQSVKVSTERLDNLINMIGELVIAQAMVHQDVANQLKENQRLNRNVSHLGKITRELQDLSMSMRMVPIQGVFQKMSRLVRDLARKTGKEIELVLNGGETELDRNVVEAIADPLVHMVRNACDHGIELPNDREQLDKPRQGRLELKAYHQAGNIVIEIVDDGRGLNKKRILKKAIDNGLVKEGAQLSDQEIFSLIFAAGLSTAEKVTDVSGRGVGMDVVRRNVEALRGRIDIQSEEGKGSTFSIRLPLTLAVIDGLIVRVGAERYIVPITSIEQSMQPKGEQISTVQDKGELCMIRGQVLPLFRLYKLFNVSPTNEDPTKALVVIVQDNQSRCCLLVDELLGQQQVVIKSLGADIGHIKGISGGAILGDGNVSLILDIPGIIQLASTNK